MSEDIEITTNYEDLPEDVRALIEDMTEKMSEGLSALHCPQFYSDSSKTASESFMGVYLKLQVLTASRQ
jgi:hypothetical protein